MWHSQPGAAGPAGAGMEEGEGFKVFLGFFVMAGWRCPCGAALRTGTLWFLQIIAFCSSASSLGTTLGVKCCFLICFMPNASGMRLIFVP